MNRKLCCPFSILHAFEQIHDFDAERLCHQMEAGKRDVHPPVLESPYLCPMKTSLIREFILRQPTLGS